MTRFLLVKVDTPRKRIWAVLAGLWCLLSLPLAVPYADYMLGYDSVINVLFVFLFLCLAPFIPIIHRWVSPSNEYRRILWVLVTALAGALLLVASGVYRYGETAMIITFFWWIVFSLAWWLHGKDVLREKKTLREAFASLVWVLGIFSAILAMLIGAAIGLLIDFGIPYDSYVGVQPGVAFGQLGGLTIWALLWYHFREGKPQLYRWRNLIFVVVTANWIGIAFGSVILGPIVIFLGIFYYVVPKPKELQGK